MKWDKGFGSDRLLLVLVAKVLSERRLNVGESNHNIMFYKLLVCVMSYIDQCSNTLF